jgi:NADPH:quinone reductase-like Zn-dependent oxidoreductase
VDPGDTTRSSTFPHFVTRSLADCRRVLIPKGTLVPASNTRNRWIRGFSRIFPARLTAPFISYRMLAPEIAQNKADLVALAALIEAGKVTPVIDRTYPLVQVPEAIRHFEQGHTRGHSPFRAGTHPREDRHHHVRRDGTVRSGSRIRRA